MSDLIDRNDAVEAIEFEKVYMTAYKGSSNGYVSEGNLFEKYNKGLDDAIKAINSIAPAEPEPKWIPVTEALPEDKTWYLGIFKESDTGYCISIPFVCYYAGRKTMITTKDYWILRGYDSFSEYLENVECAAWMPLPKPYER